MHSWGLPKEERKKRTNKVLEPIRVPYQRPQKMTTPPIYRTRGGYTLDTLEDLRLKALEDYFDDDDYYSY